MPVVLAPGAWRQTLAERRLPHAPIGGRLVPIGPGLGGRRKVHALANSTTHDQVLTRVWRLRLPSDRLHVLYSGPRSSREKLLRSIRLAPEPAPGRHVQDTFWQAQARREFEDVPQKGRKQACLGRMIQVDRSVTRCGCSSMAGWRPTEKMANSSRKSTPKPTPRPELLCSSRLPPRTLLSSHRATGLVLTNQPMSDIPNMRAALTRRVSKQAN